jgi:predicted MFS family arabinose efflux permease
VNLIARDHGIGVGRGADLLGALLITSALMLGVYTIVKPAADDGWGSVTTLAFGAGALVLLLCFVVREATARTPLIPLRIFRSRNVSGANAIQALTVAGMFGMFFMGALYMQRVLHYDALQIGLAFLPATLIMGSLSLRYSERLITRFGARRTLLPGLVLIMASLILFVRSPVGGRYVVDVLPTMVLLGTGVGVCFPALMTLSMSGATQSDAGLASGLVNTSLQVGGALGLAVLATLASTRAHNLQQSGHSVAASLNSGYHLAYLVGAALVLAAVAIAVTLLRGERREAPAGDKHAELAGNRPAYSQACS